MDLVTLLKNKRAHLFARWASNQTRAVRLLSREAGEENSLARVTEELVRIRQDQEELVENLAAVATKLSDAMQESDGCHNHGTQDANMGTITVGVSDTTDYGSAEQAERAALSILDDKQMHALDLTIRTVPNPHQQTASGYPGLIPAALAFVCHPWSIPDAAAPVAKGSSTLHPAPNSGMDLSGAPARNSAPTHSWLFVPVDITTGVLGQPIPCWTGPLPQHLSVASVHDDDTATVTPHTTTQVAAHARVRENREAVPTPATFASGVPTMQAMYSPESEVSSGSASTGKSAIRSTSINNNRDGTDPVCTDRQQAVTSAASGSIVEAIANSPDPNDHVASQGDGLLPVNYDSDDDGWVNVSELRLIH